MWMKREVSVVAGRVQWVVLAMVVGGLVVGCLRKDKEKRDPQAAAMVQQALGALHSDGGVGGPVVKEILAVRVDGGAGLQGLRVVTHVDAPSGLHVRLSLADAQGQPLAEDRLVVFCVTTARAGEPEVVPVDSSLEEPAKVLLNQAMSFTVTHASTGAGCLRPVVRVESLRQAREPLPAGSSPQPQ